MMPSSLPKHLSGHEGHVNAQIMNEQRFFARAPTYNYKETVPVSSREELKEKEMSPFESEDEETIQTSQSQMVETEPQEASETMNEDEQIQYEEMVFETPTYDNCSKKEKAEDIPQDDISTLDGCSQLCPTELPDLYYSTAGTDIDFEFQMQESIVDHLGFNQFESTTRGLLRKLSVEERCTVDLVHSIKASEALKLEERDIYLQPVQKEEPEEEEKAMPFMEDDFVDQDMMDKFTLFDRSHPLKLNKRTSSDDWTEIQPQSDDFFEMGMAEFSTPSLTKKNSFDDRNTDCYRDTFEPRALNFTIPEQSEPLIRVPEHKEVAKQLSYSEKVNTNPDAHLAAKFKIVKKNRAMNRGRNPSAAKDAKMKRYKEKYQQKKRKLTEALERAETSSELSGPEKSYTLAQNLPNS